MKVIQPLLVVAAIAINVVPGLGQIASAGIIAGLTVGAAVTTLGITAGIGLLESALNKPAKTQLSQLDRLNASINPSAPRKLVQGRTAMGTDIRYVEPSGTNQEYLDYIIAVAAHRVQLIEELWIDDKLAWTRSGGVAPGYAGYLTVDPREEGSAANTIAINGGAKWGANDRLTGCAYIHLRIKRTGNDKKATSPFSGGLSSRLTIIGLGAFVYDPRLDSTVPGGNGSQRATDQTTWTYGDAENTALQALFYLLGWRINGQLSVGRGIPEARIDLASFLEAANLCGEQVGMSAGGTEFRYATAMVSSEADEPSAVLGVYANSCNGRFRDANGKLSLAIIHNDLALAATDAGLGDDDMLGGFSWDSDPSLEQSYNVVRGQWCDPSTNSLYQQVDYPEVRLPSPDGIDRVLTLNLPAVESASRAQRIAKQALKRKQYQRTLTQTFTAVAWRYKIGDVVPVTMSALGFNRKLFRVQQQTITMDGTCPMVLTEENAAIYAWDNSDVAPVTAAAPTTYDPLNDPIVLGIADAGTTAAWPGVTGVGKPDDYAVNTRNPSAPLGTGGDTVNSLLSRTYTLEQITGQNGSIQQQFAKLQGEIDQAGSNDPRTDVLVTQVTGLEASARGAGSFSPNLLVNPGFGDGLNNWVQGAGNWNIVNGFDSSPFVQCGSANAYLYQDVPCSAGSFYSLSSNQAPDTAGGGYIKVDWFNSNGQNLGEANAPHVGVGTAGQWARGFSADNSYKAPAGAVKARVYLVVASSSGGNARFSQVQFQLGGVPTPFRDDSTVNYNASRLTSEIALRTNQAGTYANQISTLTSQFAGNADSWLKSQIQTTQGTLSTTTSTLSTRIDTLSSSISSLNSPNLLANGSFANGLSGWNAFGGASWSVVTQYNPIFAQSPNNGYSGLYTTVNNIQPGKNYCFGFESDNDGGDNAVYICCRWFDANGTSIRDDNGTTARPGSGWGNRVANGPYQAPSNAKSAQIIFYLYGSGTGNKRVARAQFQQSDKPTAYSDASSLQAVQAQVTQQAGTLADLSGKLQAYYSVTANAGGATAFVSLNASVNGQVTSDVAIGAKSIALYNQAGNNYLKTLVVENGNVVIYGNLAVLGQITTGHLAANSVSNRILLSGGSQTWTGNGSGGGYTPPSGGGGAGGSRTTQP